MNAYEMADELESLHLFASQERLAAVMLRQQADRIAELEKECQKWFLKYQEYLVHGAPQTKPLSDEEILEEYRQCYGDEGTLTDCYFARAIEAKVRGQ